MTRRKTRCLTPRLHVCTNCGHPLFVVVFDGLSLKCQSLSVTCAILLHTRALARSSSIPTHANQTLAQTLCNAKSLNTLVRASRLGVRHITHITYNLCTNHALAFRFSEPPRPSLALRAECAENVWSASHSLANHCRKACATFGRGVVVACHVHTSACNRHMCKLFLAMTQNPHLCHLVP